MPSRSEGGGRRRGSDPDLADKMQLQMPTLKKTRSSSLSKKKKSGGPLSDAEGGGIRH